MKRFYHSNKLIDAIPTLKKIAENIVYLMIPSIRYFFNKSTLNYNYILNLENEKNLLKICSETDMIEFIKKYNIIKNTEYGKDGQLNWDLLKKQFKGIEFIWYKSFEDCSKELQLQIDENFCHEWYQNIETECGCIWNIEKIKNMIFIIQSKKYIFS